MESQQTWAEALKISPEKLSEWSSEAPAETPLLVWCLENGRVNVEEYLEWACQHHGLPILNSAFFSQNFDRQSLEPLRKDTTWNPWCYPVGQWDDVTLVACTEPPSAMPEGHYAYLLADPAVMREVWGQTQAGAAPVDAPAGINPNVTRTFVLNLDSDAVMNENSAVMEPNMIEKAEDDQSENTLSVVRVIPPTKTPPVAASTPPPAPVKKAAAVSAQSTPPPTPAAKAPPVAKAALLTDETEINTAFDRLHQDYQAALVMRCSEGFAKPYKWDTHLEIKPDDERCNFNLNFPSFFRIVAKTLQPYHGYVIDSPVHREFFESLNFAAPPACVTAIPVIANGVLWGILVAFGGEAAQTTDALNQAITIVEKLSKTLFPAPTKVA